ncbi:MAG: hypothetical protein E6R05_03710 [Candidatus Moraniibacteriota bacterium]|nr:MAG: hypothetical protein E6R05_03710 [Candidatus Moranbacteria bacterium]
MNTNPKAKRILIYGDSYTYGKIPGGNRYDSATRFTGVLQKELGENYEVIEEGLRGRVISGEHPFFPHRDGLAQFDGIIGSHLPLDLVCLFLGTNETNSGSTKSSDQIVTAYDAYQDRLKKWSDFHNCSIPKLIIVTPPYIKEEESYKAFKHIFKDAQKKIISLTEQIADYSKHNSIQNYDARHIGVSDIDGVHLDISANRQIGEELAVVVKRILSKSS